MKFILASKSPRRRELLKNIGMNFEVVESAVDESTVDKDLKPELYVQELAMLKSSSVASRVGEDCIVIGADTVVVFKNKIIGKPKDYDDAFSMLKSFSGSFHSVYTGISLSDGKSGKTVTDYCKTDVYFAEMSDFEISKYIDTYKPYDKAGAYGIQEYAGVFTDKIDGDYFNVVGLPVSKLYGLLKKEFEIFI